MKKMIIKKYLVKIVRGLNLAGLSDNVRFTFFLLKNLQKNKRVQRLHSSFSFPPPYYLYETYHLDYEAYLSDGLQTAKEIIQLFSENVNFGLVPTKILDWGCGPGRIVRHLPEILPLHCSIDACDYNEKYITWCNSNISGVNFRQNNLVPPTTFSDNTFDAIYGLSIITHLSAQSHSLWIRELYRILKPGGLLLITSQGEAFRKKLLPAEETSFNLGNLVVRESKMEGHRVYSAFQPKRFMQELLQEFVFIRFIPGGSKESILGLQDTWLIKKALP